MKEKREPWYWSDNDVDPWSSRFAKWVPYLLMVAVIPASSIPILIAGESVKSRGGMLTISDYLFAAVITFFGYQAAALLPSIGQLVVGLRRGLKLRYIVFFGAVYEAEKRKFIRGPGLIGPVFQVLFHRPKGDLTAFGAMLRAGATLSVLTVPLAAMITPFPGFPDFLRQFAAALSIFSLMFAIINLLPYRIAATFVSGGYFIRWLKHDPSGVRRELDWGDQWNRYFLCSPRDWDLSVMLAKHQSPEDYPFRQMLRLVYTQDQGDFREYGLILEESLTNWPRGEPGNLTGSLMSRAAIFFVHTVDDKLRAQHYATRAARNLQSSEFDLLPVEVIRLVRSGHQSQAKNKVAMAVGRLNLNYPAFREYLERQYAAALESTAPEFTAEEWAEICRSRLGDA